MENEAETILDHYIIAALWSTSDNSDESGGDPLDQNYGREDIAPETLKAMQADCEAFWVECAGSITDENFNGGVSEGYLQQAGHDFWLTRCGHGAGFWDGQWQEPAATLLTGAAHRFGNVDLYVGDDGLIYS